MISLRLPKELEDKLEALSKKENMTKSDVIREAIEKYLAEQDKLKQPFELGRDLFGKYGSGDGKLSVEYKKKVREKIHEKMSR
jgi:predicted DNA-binding protein